MKYTTELGKKVAEAYARVGSYNAAGKEIGVRDGTAKAWIMRYAKETGKPVRKPTKKAKSAKRAKGGVKYTFALGKQACEAYQEHGTYVTAARSIGVAPTTCMLWSKRYQADAKKDRRTAKRNGVKAVVSGLQQLQDENAFLLWWCDGERKGYVERLLAKLND